MNHLLTRMVLMVTLAGCASLGQYSNGDVRFGPRNNLGMIEYDPIQEASGIVASRKNSNVLWTHNDSGVPAIYALNTRGRHLGEYVLQGCNEPGWEDIALAYDEESGKDFIYIGAIGDNRQRRKSRSICRIVEPDVYEDQDTVTENLHEIELMRFRYPDGSYDAETLLVDPQTGELYVITKRIIPAGVYRVPSSFGTFELETAEMVAELPYRWIVGGDISRDGTEILIKTYTAIYYWRRQAGESLADVFTRSPETVPYVWEAGGEAVGWGPAADGYYTVSEEILGIPARLFYYPRLKEN